MMEIMLLPNTLLYRALVSNHNSECFVMFQTEQVDSVSMSLVYHTMQGLTTGCGLANLTLPSLCQTYRLLHCTQPVAARKWKYHPERDLAPPEQFTNTNQPPDRLAGTGHYQYTSHYLIISGIVFQSSPELQISGSVEALSPQDRLRSCGA
jgi:hypothetical protein